MDKKIVDQYCAGSGIDIDLCLPIAGSGAKGTFGIRMMMMKQFVQGYNEDDNGDDYMICT